MTTLQPYEKMMRMDAAVWALLADTTADHADAPKLIAFREGYFNLPADSRIRLHDIIMAASEADLKRKGID